MDHFHVIRKNDRTVDPAVSFVLLDWGCRESFHTVEYLSNLVTDREKYEVIWIEYYDRRPGKLDEIVGRYETNGLPSPIDTWVVMARPKGEIFKKHWMNNVGFLHSRGRIVVFMDSDAITSATIVDTIVKEFDNDPEVMLYLEEIRTRDPRFYPFRYPNAKEIIPVAYNMSDGVPHAMTADRPTLLADPSLIHTGGNYGACFAARRDDLIRFGGWDEHDDYTGYIAGPYEMSLRMEWGGKKERWSYIELLWHTPHPGNDGIGNYSGPHDGKGVSLTAMRIFDEPRTLPHVENPDIRALRVERFGVEPPPMIPERPKPPEKPHVNRPTVGGKPRPGYVPSRAATAWDKYAIYLLGKMVEGVESQALGYAYPKATTLASYAATLARQLQLPAAKVEAIYVAGLFRGFEDAFRRLKEKGGGDATFALGANTTFPWNEDPFVTVAEADGMKGERYDGGGPKGESGRRVGMVSQIVDLAEAFDDLVHVRSDGARPTLFVDAHRRLAAESGKRFDPDLIDAFIACAEDMICVHLKAQNGQLFFFYPCFAYGIRRGYSGSSFISTASTLPKVNDFVLVPSDNGDRLRYYALPGWDVPEERGGDGALKKYIYSSSNYNNVAAYTVHRQIDPDYRGHRIITYAGRYFAIPHRIPEFFLQEYTNGKYALPCHEGKSLVAVKAAVIGAALWNRIRKAVPLPA